jgi:hypothetical protein
MIPQQSSHSRWSYDTKPGNHSLCSKQYMYKHTSAIDCSNIVDSMRKILLPCSLSMSMESDQSYSHTRMVPKVRPMVMYLTAILGRGTKHDNPCCDPCTNAPPGSRSAGCDPCMQHRKSGYMQPNSPRKNLPILIQLTPKNRPFINLSRGRSIRQGGRLGDKHRRYKTCH